MEDKIRLAQIRANRERTEMLITKTTSGQLIINSKKSFDSLKLETKSKYEIVQIIAPSTIEEDLIYEEFEVCDLYEHAIIKVDLKALKQIKEKNKNFSNLLVKGILNYLDNKNEDKKHLSAWFSTDIVCMTNSCNDIKLVVDGETVYKT